MLNKAGWYVEKYGLECFFLAKKHLKENILWVTDYAGLYLLKV